jgi:hypothetical protein
VFSTSSCARFLSSIILFQKENNHINKRKQKQTKKKKKKKTYNLNSKSIVGSCNGFKISLLTDVTKSFICEFEMDEAAFVD